MMAFFIGRPSVGGGNECNGDVQADVARELCVRAGLRRNYIGASGQKKDIIESESLRNGKMNHKFLGIPQLCG